MNRELMGYDRIFRRRMLHVQELRIYQDEMLELIAFLAKLVHECRRVLPT
jgi:hypothetical protein